MYLLIHRARYIIMLAISLLRHCWNVIYSLLLSCCLTCIVINAAAAVTTSSNVALFYGPKPPLNALQAFDIAIFDPSSGVNPKQFNNRNSQAYAYVSVGEVSPKRSYYKNIQRAWILGRNPNWNSEVVDQSSTAWRAFFIKQVIRPLWERGFRGFFLDTLDSFNLVATTPSAKQQQIQGLIQLIKDIKAVYPDAQLIFNRGFEILTKVHQHVAAVAVESLYAGWNPIKKRYEAVSKADRSYLLTQLDKLKAYKFPIIIIDYLPPKQRQKARSVATKISKLGYIPWISNYQLDSLGVGRIEVIPRDVLVLYDDTGSDNLSAPAFRLLAMPLEQLGLVPHFHHVSQPLPSGVLRGRYAGIVVWLSSDNTVPSKEWQQWLRKQLQDGMRFAFFNHFGLPADNKNLAILGLKFQAAITHMGPSKIKQQSSLFGFEAEPLVAPESFLSLHVLQGSPLLTLSDQQGHIAHMAALMPWGGYVLAPYAITSLPNDSTLWAIDPFKFIQQALQLPTMPIPDVTTENGRRLLLVHIDGDGFANHADWYQNPLAGQVMDEEILQKYRIPTTVSIVQGEIASDGLYPQKSAELEKIARHIFKHPWVEMASHTYSHPFQWRKLEHSSQASGYNLAIPNYQFNIKKEILGSIDYINRHLAPESKRCHIMLWSGDTDPSSQVLKLCKDNQIKNLNGGDTTISYDRRSITNIAPLGIYKGSYFQVFAPNQNENVYTNLWRGPFYGYQRVIETFKLTDKPHRYKPMNIYYHFYSASKRASLQALNKVYSYALAQPTLPLYASEYIDKVLAFNRLVIAKRSSGGWLIRRNGALRELRVSQQVGYPSLGHNVIGYSDYNQDRYIHLGPSHQTIVNFVKHSPQEPYLSNANSQIVGYHYDATRKHYELRFKSYLPLQLNFANTTNCVILDGNTAVNSRAKESNVIRINCRV